MLSFILLLRELVIYSLIQTFYYIRSITPNRVTSWRCHLRVRVPRQRSYLRKCWKGGKPFVRLCKIWSAWDSKSRSPAHDARVITVRPSRRLILFSIFKFWVWHIFLQYYQYGCQFLLFICSLGTHYLRQRRDHFGLRIKLPPVTTSPTTQR